MMRAVSGICSICFSDVSLPLGVRRMSKKFLIDSIKSPLQAAVSRRELLVGAASLSVIAAGSSWAQFAEAATATFDYYISPTGSDSNSGTQASPWAITALCDASKTQIRGKRIGLLDGTYVIKTTKDQGNQMMIPVLHGGSGETARTVIQAVNPRAAILTNNNNGSWTTYPNTPALFGILPGVDYVTFKDLRFQSLVFAAVYAQGNYIRVDGCDIYDIDLTRSAGYPADGDNVGAILTGGEGHDLVIYNCRIEKVNNGARKSSGTNANACAIGPFFHYSNITVDSCSLYDATIGVHFKDDYSIVAVKNCYFHPTIDQGIWGINGRSAARPAGKNTASNNVFNRQNQFMCNSYGDMQADCDIVGNTFVAGPNSGANGAGVIFEPAGHANPGNAWALNFYNNIFYSPTSNGAYTIVFKQSYPATSAIKTMDSNVYPTNFSARDDNVGGSYAFPTWRAHVGSEASSRLLADPLFVNSNGTSPADFKLATTSLLKTAGLLLGSLVSGPIGLGAWGNGTQVGHNFGAVIKPDSPVIHVS